MGQISICSQKSYLHESCFPLKTNKLAIHTHTLEISHNALDSLQKWTESSSRKAVSLCWPLSRTEQSPEGVGVWRAGEGPVPWLREEVPGRFFIRNSFEMEARGRSEACRIRLGQASAQESRATPPLPSQLWYQTVILSCILRGWWQGPQLTGMRASLPIHTGCGQA